MVNHPPLRMAAISLRPHAGTVNEPEGLPGKLAPQLRPRTKTL